MLLKSDQINELAAALAKAQAEIKDAELDSNNPHYRNDFSSLQSVLKAIRPTFSKYGLSISQVPGSTESGEPYLTTLLMHSSGQYIGDSLRLILSKNDMQGMGSAFTYSKRQTAQAVAGIAMDQDDDGNAASSKKAPMTVAKKAKTNATVEEF